MSFMYATGPPRQTPHKTNEPYLKSMYTTLQQNQKFWEKQK